LFAVLTVASVRKGLNRILSKLFAFLVVSDWEQRQIDRGWQGKSAAFGPAHVVGGVEVLERAEFGHAIAPLRNLKEINAPRAVGLREFAERRHGSARQ
jgi:hypothetical protein